MSEPRSEPHPPKRKGIVRTHDIRLIADKKFSAWFETQRKIRTITRHKNHPSVPPRKDVMTMARGVAI